MLEVKIPKEIKDYKSKLVYGLTVRQVVAIICALLVGVPLGVFGARYIPQDYLLWLVILSVTPIILWGFITYKGMRFEEYAKVLYKFFMFPQKRVYEDVNVNYFCFVHEILSARNIRQQRIAEGEIDEDKDDENLNIEEDSYVF